ncbi:hypothetical protein LHL08_22500, partial [Escherichia coli]|uniref:hypothetical protein n=1 Tax=Escherichia coli TaxID=562 RepID=UPI001CFB30F1
TGGTADRNRSHWSTSKTPSYTKSVSWQHHRVVFSKKKIPTHGRDSDGEKELTAVAEDPQQHQEQVDEVQIQG